MFNKIFERVIERQELRLGESLDYLREIREGSNAAFLKVALLTPFTNHRKRLPKTAYHLAKILVTRHEDCGACVQMAINVAASDGVPEHYIRAVLNQRTEDLPVALQEVCEYAQAIAQGANHAALRARLVERYGKEGLIELSMAIASAQIYPTLKRAMGHTTTCATTEFRVNRAHLRQESLVLGVEAI